MKKLFIAACTALAVAGLAAPAQAQVQFGPQLDFADDFDFGVGARAQFGIGSLFETEELADLQAAVSFDYFFPDCAGFDCSYLEINGNGLYPFELQDSDFTPYVGAGLNLALFSAEFTDPITGATTSESDTDVGVNLLGGAAFDLGGFDVFAEARIELGGGEQFVLTFGTLFGGD